MTRPGAEMACSEPDEPEPRRRFLDPETKAIGQGIAIGMAAGLALWVLLGWLVWRVVW